MSVVFTSFKRSKLPISVKIPVTLLQKNCLYLHDSYISKFEFMNYHYANLLVAWLYVLTNCTYVYLRVFYSTCFDFCSSLKMSVHFIFIVHMLQHMIIQSYKRDSDESQNDGLAWLAP